MKYVKYENRNIIETVDTLYYNIIELVHVCSCGNPESLRTIISGRVYICD